MLYFDFVLEFRKLIAAKIDLSHIATDIIYSEVLICKVNQLENWNVWRRISFYSVLAVCTVIVQCRLKGCAVGGGSGIVLENDQAVLNCLH